MRPFGLFAIAILLAGPALATGFSDPRALPLPALHFVAEKTKEGEGTKRQHFFKSSTLLGVEPTTKEEKEKIRQLQRQAEKGDPEAQFRLAEKLQRQAKLEELMPPAAGRNASLAEAADWYRKAADQGHGTARRRLADLYFDGEKGVENPTEALRLYRGMAGEDDAFAQLRLGEAYEKGIGVAPDAKAAIHWYDNAAKHVKVSDVAKEARYRIGKIYAAKGDKKANRIRAYRWFDLAAARGHKEADAARRNLEKRMSLAEIVAAKKEARAWQKTLSNEVKPEEAKKSVAKNLDTPHSKNQAAP